MINALQSERSNRSPTQDRSQRQRLSAGSSTPEECDEPVWSHYATYAATLRAYAEAMAEENLGPGTQGAQFAEHVYRAELDNFREAAEVRRRGDTGRAPEPGDITE